MSSYENVTQIHSLESAMGELRFSFGSQITWEGWQRERKQVVTVTGHFP